MLGVFVVVEWNNLVLSSVSYVISELVWEGSILLVSVEQCVGIVIVLCYDFEGVFKCCYFQVKFVFVGIFGVIKVILVIVVFIVLVFWVKMMVCFDFDLFSGNWVLFSENFGLFIFWQQGVEVVNYVFDQFVQWFF